MANTNISSFPVSAPLAEQHWTKRQQQLLDFLEHEENRSLPVSVLCQRAGVSQSVWYDALKNPRFVAVLEAWGVKTGRLGVSHIHVTPAKRPEEELEKDVWDMRRLKSDYPKHKSPSAFKVDFSWIANPELRLQVKDYFRLHLAPWKARTFAAKLEHMKHLLKLLPTETHIGTLDRRQIEELLPQLLNQASVDAANRSLLEMKTMLNYMATSPTWSGPRPPRFLIWNEDIPSESETLPRPIPPDVLTQLDILLEQGVQMMNNQEVPPLFPAYLWDGILVLRRTGMRSEDLAHLKTPDEHGRNGCLEQDTEGYWWLRIHHKMTKMGRDHRIPTKSSDGVIDAIHRQRERIKDIPDHFREQYLFRTTKGVLTYDSIRRALAKLAPQLLHEGHPYVAVPHQFRHSIATDMIEMGVDIYTVKEFLGHKSLAMTEKYVQVYLTSLKSKYDAYRAKKQQTYATEMLASQVQVTQIEGDTDGGWVDGKVGKLYLSPLPDGAGNCAHLPMLDPCPDVPHCPTCPKLRASVRHLPMWENKVKSLRLTVEALRANPLYDRARQKHEQELRHAEKVVVRLTRFWGGLERGSRVMGASSFLMKKREKIT